MNYSNDYGFKNIKKPRKIMQYIWKYILEDGLCTASFQNYAEELFIAFSGGR